MVKKADTLRPFVNAKLLISIYKSLAHRTSAAEDAGDITNTVVGKLIGTRSAQIDINYIKKVVYETLSNFDSAAAMSYHAYHNLDNGS
jgi:transcriptional regulator NrdR family protein